MTPYDTHTIFVHYFVSQHFLLLESWLLGLFFYLFKKSSFQFKIYYLLALFS